MMVRMILVVKVIAAAGVSMSKQLFASPLSSTTSRLVYLRTHVTRHTSHVTRHTSHVTRHTSHVTRRGSWQRQQFACRIWRQTHVTITQRRQRRRQQQQQQHHSHYAAPGHGAEEVVAGVGAEQNIVLAQDLAARRQSVGGTKNKFKRGFGVVKEGRFGATAHLVEAVHVEYNKRFDGLELHLIESLLDVRSSDARLFEGTLSARAADASREATASCMERRRDVT
jgi:hypothetical protein